MKLQRHEQICDGDVCANVFLMKQKKLLCGGDKNYDGSEGQSYVDLGHFNICDILF